MDLEPAPVQLRDGEKKLVDRVAQKAGFENYVVVSHVGANRGDNYLGIIKTVKVISKEKKKELNLVLKTAQASKEFRIQASVPFAFEREIFVYKKIFPEFARFQRENGIKEPFSGYPKVYATSMVDGCECVVMENLREIGYRLWNRKIPMNAEHLKSVFIEYAKFHAVSFAMKALERETYAEITEDFRNVFEKQMTENDYDQYLNSQIAVGLEVVKDHKQALKALRSFYNDAREFFKVTIRKENKSWVIRHGDCWNNNFMFKYNDPDASHPLPIKVSILDWQLAATGPVVCDISYFFYTATSKECLYKLDEYLKLYHNTLSASLEEYGLIADKIFSFADLKEDWKKYSKFGLHGCISSLKVMLGEPHEVPDLEEAVKAGRSIMDSFNVNIEKAETYKQRVCEIVEFMIERGYL